MNTQQVLVGKWGKIIAGKQAGWYVLVEDDTDGSTGGFYVFISPVTSGKNGFDDWFEKLDGVQRQFQFNGWEIQWLDSDPVSSK